ncbi:MAG TPA: LysM peptidoglycan-binding domain-containing protein [Acidiferrobacterales bacterium]|jgi:nucleoid-associated protein YgaU
MDRKNADRVKVLAIVAALAVLGACATTEEEPAPAPAPEPSAAPSAAPAPEPAPSSTLPTSYSVVRGDNLWNIAGQSRIYGNPYQWPLIYKSNSDKIKDADLIYPGQVFAIERNASRAEMDAAVRHARTRGAWSLGAVEDTDRAYLAGSR